MKPSGEKINVSNNRASLFAAAREAEEKNSTSLTLPHPQSARIDYIMTEIVAGLKQTEAKWAEQKRILDHIKGIFTRRPEKIYMFPPEWSPEKIEQNLAFLEQQKARVYPEHAHCIAGLENMKALRPLEDVQKEALLRFEDQELSDLVREYHHLLESQSMDAMRLSL